MRKFGLAIALTGLCAACAAETAVSLPELEVRVTPRTVWAGNTLYLESGAFAVEPTPPSVMIDERQLDVAQVDERTFSVVLPDDIRAGSHEPEITLRGQPLIAEQFGVAGLLDARSAGQVYHTDFFRRATHTARPTVVGYAGPDDPAIFLDLQTLGKMSGPDFVKGQLREVPSSYQSSVYPGCATREGSQFTTIIPWTVGSPSFALPHTSIYCDRLRGFVQIGPDTHILGDKDAIRRPDFFYETAVGGLRTSLPLGGRFAPALDRVIMAAQWVSNGLPVFAVPSGELLYQLADVAGSVNPEFSPDGRTIALSRYDVGPDVGDNRIALFDADDGALMAERDLGGPVFAIAYDPGRPRLYVAHRSSRDSSRISVAVLDPESLAHKGQMSASIGEAGCNQFCLHRGVLAVGPGQILYLAARVGSQTQVFRFAIPDMP